MIQIPAPMVNADTLPVKTHLARWRAANAMAAKKVLSPIPESATVASAVENPAMLVTSYLIILVFFFKYICDPWYELGFARLLMFLSLLSMKSYCLLWISFQIQGPFD